MFDKISREGTVLAVALVFLTALSRYNYLLFHTAIELYTICVAFSIVMIVVNSQRYVKNSFFTFLGISCGFAAIFDFVHTMAYSGMQIFPEYGNNLAPQMWLIARYLEGGAMIAAFQFIKRPVRTDWLIGGYTVLATVLLLSVFQWQVFPAAFIDGQGLTPFKIWSEYILCALMVFSVYLLYRHRDEFHPEVRRFLMTAYVLTIGTEIAFTLYVDMYGLSNLFGHIFKALAYYCLYQAVIKNSLREPYKTLFFEIDQTNRALNQEVVERKKAEAGLRETKEYLDNLLNYANAPVIVWDANYRITLFNRAFERLTGREAVEVIGQELGLLFPEQLRQQSMDYIRTTTGEHWDTVEITIAHKDGGERNLLWNSATLYAVDGKTVMATIAQGNDISERKRVEKVLRESEERYRALMMQSQDAVFLLDLETLVCVEANPKFEQMTGYRLAPETPLHIFDIMDDSQVNVMRNLDQLQVTGALPPAVRKVKTKQGRRLQVERTACLIKAGTRNYQLTTFRDVTEDMKRQREMQKELALAAQVQRALLPATPRSSHFRIETLFRPQSFVSGDVYHLEWGEADKVLRGFLIDITGHGLATALQTAAVNVLLHEVMDLPLSMSVSERLCWLNRRIPQYIDEISFAAAIAFEADFAVGELRYASAGITDVLFNSRRITSPGLFLGIDENEQYETKKMPFSSGDSVCFMSDGITDVLTAEQLWEKIPVREICEVFNDETYTEKIKDDATAICITAIDSAEIEQR